AVLLRFSITRVMLCWRLSSALRAGAAAFEELRGIMRNERKRAPCHHDVSPRAGGGAVAGLGRQRGGSTMNERRSTMPARKRIALIAHDNRKHDLLEWARFNAGTLRQHDLFATGTTGGLLASELGLEVTRFLSGPLGGDQQVGAAIAEGRIDAVIFF